MATKWPTVVSALVALWQGAVGQDDAVYDGPPVTTDLPLRWVTVGWAQDQTGAAGGHAQRAQVNDGEWGETGSVLCEIVAQSGDPDNAALRTSAFAFYDVLTAAIEADRRLGGVLSPDSMIDCIAEPFPEADASAGLCRIRVSVNYTTT